MSVVHSQELPGRALTPPVPLSQHPRVPLTEIRGGRRKLGANYVHAGLWRGFAIRDGNLITGQQNFSGSETARAVIAALGE